MQNSLLFLYGSLKLRKVSLELYVFNWMLCNFTDSCEFIFRHRSALLSCLLEETALVIVTQSIDDLAFTSRRSYKRGGSFIRRTINNAQRVLKAIGAMYWLHPVSTLRRSRLTRQVQVPIVELWIRETCSIPTPCALEESSYKIMIHHASRWRLRQRAHMKARNKPAAGPENFAAVSGVCSLSLFFSYLYIEPWFR